MKKELEFDVSANEKIGLGLLNNHVHFLFGEIDEENVTECIKWIVYENVTCGPVVKTLTLYINSVGGSLNDSFALIDIMKKSRCPIRVIGIGTIASAAFMIFSAGTKGQRYIAENTSIMCHQYSDSYEGKHHDIKSRYRENELTNTRMINILKQNTGLDTRTIKTKLLGATDTWLTAEELIELGIADDLFHV
jgi:ATP-dependent Clp endopeptidase proteolytic subunit ClpP